MVYYFLPAPIISGNRALYRYFTAVAQFTPKAFGALLYGISLLNFYLSEDDATELNPTQFKNIFLPDASFRHL
jgi:hypothetical protein